MNNNAQENNAQKVKVWDLPLRIFHWALAVAFAVSFISIEIDNMEVHIISANVILGLLIFRLLWGFLGSHTARFTTFIPSPRQLINYLRNKDTDESVGHSPLGALSVLALLLLMLFQLLTGLVADDEIYITGPLRDWVSSSFSSWATSKHVWLADILLGMIGLHIAAILFYWVVKKNNLIKPMITGYKTLNQKLAQQTYAQMNIIIAVIVIIVAAICAYGVFNWL